MYLHWHDKSWQQACECDLQPFPLRILQGITVEFWQMNCHPEDPEVKRVKFSLGKRSHVAEILVRM